MAPPLGASALFGFLHTYLFNPDSADRGLGSAKIALGELLYKTKM
jgi:hypothetical protein